MKRFFVSALFCTCLFSYPTADEVNQWAKTNAAQILMQFASKPLYLKSQYGYAIKTAAKKISGSNIEDEDHVDDELFAKIRDNKFILIDCIGAVTSEDEAAGYEVRYEYLFTSPKVPFNIWTCSVSRGISPDRIAADFLSVASTTNTNPINPTWSATIKKAILEKKVRLGMTKAQAEAAWGKPERINSTTTALGTREQWVYDDENYLYFENGRVSAIQN